MDILENDSGDQQNFSNDGASPFRVDINPICVILDFDGIVSIQPRKLRFCREMGKGVMVFLPEDLEQHPEIVWYLPEGTDVEDIQVLVRNSVSKFRDILTGWTVNVEEDNSAQKKIVWKSKLTAEAQSLYIQVKIAIEDPEGLPF